MVSNPWNLLLLAGVFEIGLAVSLKLSEGFSKWLPTVTTVLATVLSFYFLSKSLKNLPIGTAYAVWTSIGAAGTAVVGSFLFGECWNLSKVLFFLMILTGVVGLKLTSP